MVMNVFADMVAILIRKNIKRKMIQNCNASCRNNEQEKCGRHGRISIYTTNTGKV